MQVTQANLNAFVDVIAADTGILAAATAMHCHLVINSFTPSLSLELADVTLATFTGSTPLNAGTGVQPVLLNPLTNQYEIRIKEPAGGWSWICTADPATPETVYGFILTDTADTLLIGSGLVDTPVEISAAGQGLEIGSIKLQFLNSSPY